MPPSNFRGAFALRSRENAKRKKAKNDYQETSAHETGDENQPADVLRMIVPPRAFSAG
jgi:hypothetical protein